MTMVHLTTQNVTIVHLTAECACELMQLGREIMQARKAMKPLQPQDDRLLVLKTLLGYSRYNTAAEIEHRLKQIRAAKSEILDMVFDATCDAEARLPVGRLPRPAWATEYDLEHSLQKPRVVWYSPIRMHGEASARIRGQWMFDLTDGTAYELPPYVDLKWSGDPSRIDDAIEVLQYVERDFRPGVIEPVHRSGAALVAPSERGGGA